MSVSFKKFNGRRAVAALMGLLAGYAFLDAFMLFVEGYPKRLLDPQPEHWWSAFIVAFAIAAAYYGVPDSIREQAMARLDQPLLEICGEFERRYPEAAKRSRNGGAESETLST